jgi:hypothetical protein
LRAAIPHSHYKTVTLVAGLRLRGLTAAKTFDGPINAALFEDWLGLCQSNGGSSALGAARADPSGD